MKRSLSIILLVSVPVGSMGARASAQDTSSVRIRGDSVRIRFIEADFRAVVQALAGFLDKPLLTSEVSAGRITLETPVPVPRSHVIVLLRGLVDSRGLVWSEDSAFYRIGPKVPERPLPAAASSGPDQGELQLFVLRLKHARAADVAATLNLLFGFGGGLSGRAGLSSGTLSDELRRNAVPPAGQPETVDRNRPGAQVLAGPVTMVPDELTNALLIRSRPADLELIRQAVDQVDVRPLQVLIEVLIVEVRKDRNFQLGVSVDYRKQDGVTTYKGGFGSVAAGDVAVQIMHMARSEVNALLSAAQSRGDVEITSRPVLMASNNVEAQFLVGSQRPFVQVSRSLPTDVPSRDQVVQYRDVGTKLTVRPTINQDGYVSLLIQQEISAATDETQFGAPVISTREARTQVLVRDGQTIVLGGLKDHQRDQTRSGVPILSAIPIIGGLFGSSRRHTVATELFLFLTPRILKTDADIDSVTTPRLPATSLEQRRPPQ